MYDPSIVIARCLPSVSRFLNYTNFFPLRRGLYIPDTDSYPAHFRGMGIRIEDSVCVEDDHPLVLTTEAVKEVCISSEGVVRKPEAVIG